MKRSLRRIFIKLPALILLSLCFVSNVFAASDNAVEWVISGDASAKIDAETIGRLTGRLATTGTSSAGKRISIVWPDALLESDGRPAVPIQMNVELTIGLTMAVGERTPYPGLITKVDNATGEIVDLKTRRSFVLKLFERGSWIGKLIHSDSHGPDHLALELPFSLIDESTGALVAENNLVAVFDLASPSAPIINWTRLSPTPYADLRLGTTDIGNALQSQVSEFAYSSHVPAETYKAQATVTRVSAIVDQDQHSDLFNTESLSVYNCSNEQFMELELRSSGFSQLGQMKSPPFTLQLRYVPALIAEGQVAYLDPIDGLLALHYKDSNRLIEIAPGNHGNLSSKAILDGLNTNFQLGIALREGVELPVVARLDIACRTSDAGLNCADLTLSTGTSADGITMSPRPLSGLLESQSSLTYFHSVADTTEIQPLGGGPTPCPFFCPSCRPEGCAGGVCEAAGAPLGCTAGCDHHPNTPQCCRSTGRICCVERCATPP